MSHRSAALATGTPSVNVVVSRDLCVLAIAFLASACGDTGSGAGDGGGQGGNGGGGAAGHTGDSGKAGSAAGQGPSEGGAAGGAGENPGSSGAGSQGGTTAALQPFQIAATIEGTCALAADGTIHCWGLAPEVWDVPAGEFAELHGGSDGVLCAVRADRSVTCFPQPFGLQDLSRQPSVPVQLLAIGDGAICATDLTGAASCKGSNVQFDLAPPIDELGALSVGTQFMCGLRLADGTLSCVGSPSFGSCTFTGDFGQLGAPEGAYVAVSSGANHSCAISTDGTLACWGIGKAGDAEQAPCFGELSYGQSEPPEGTFRQLRAAQNHSCAIRTDGTVACWGRGSTGDCASGEACNRSRPPAGVFDQLALGLHHTCGMKPDRTVECWGYDGEDTTTPPAVFQ